MDLLETKDKDDKWDEKILQQNYDYVWYKENDINYAMYEYYNIELTNYYS